MANFSKAFADARKAGKKTFSWQGKNYNTKLASGAKTPKKGPVPAAKPAAAKQGPSAPKPKQDYPRPAKQVGIAKPGSAISNSVAKAENAPKRPYTPTPVYPGPGTSPRSAKAPAPKSNAPKPKQGPQPEGVWYAAKGSAISIGAARRANKPKKSS